MLLNPLSLYTTNLQDNWYEDGKEEEEEEEETVGVDTSRDPPLAGGKRRMVGRRWEWFYEKEREGKRGGNEDELPRELRRNHGDR